MNIRCPSCQTVFRVDPARVPATGIRARCSRCGHAFHIAAAGQAPASESREASSPGLTPPTPVPVAQTVPAPPRPVAAAPAPPPFARASQPSAAQPAAAAGGTPVQSPVFGSKDPHARAQRIARALVSDIVAYHKGRVEETLAAGTLRTDFREEILKSWDEYLAQVGPELAKGTPFFRDALNDILARGRKVF